MSDAEWCRVCEYDKSYICPGCAKHELRKVVRNLTLDEIILEAERRGEERGWDAARRATNGCVISMDYSEGGGPRFVAISDWRASSEYLNKEKL